MLISGFISGIFTGGTFSLLLLYSLDNGNLADTIGLGLLCIVFIGLFIYLLIKNKKQRQKYWERIRKYYILHPSASLSHIMLLLNFESDNEFAELLTSVWGFSCNEVELMESRLKEDFRTHDFKLYAIDRVQTYEDIDIILKEFLANRK